MIVGQWVVILPCGSIKVMNRRVTKYTIDILLLDLQYEIISWDYITNILLF